MEASAVVTNTQAKTGTNDVFSITDQALSDRLQFVQEIGFGNWGSVWLCRPKLSSSADGLARGQKIAVKLVHRSKTPTTAARVRSLWNEMKIIRNFKNDPHPSIIPFHSFVLTPSYALITMSYLPTLVPVEVEESKAKEWFRFLLSGIEFLHKRGVVHNDIKPANILLSHKSIPVLVDFGFAEKYDLDSPTAFHSNLSYGTPEYLSPERARGLPHDTRKSDVWSLGVTFFEILIGRTPFEHSDGEQFTSKEDLEQYWQRTLKGTWVGTWKMSQEMEKFLQRMITSNADLRCTASQAMADAYWRSRHDSLSSHRRSSSYTSSVVFEKDMAKLLDLTPSSTRTMGKENPMFPPGLDSPLSVRKNLVSSRPIAKSKSQPKVNPNKVPQPKKRAHVPAVDLSPIKASPPTTPSALGKENGNATSGRANGRKPFGVLTTRNANVPVTAVTTTPSNKTFGPEDKLAKSFTNITNSGRRHSEDVQSRAVAERDTGTSKGRGKESTSVIERVRDWERERERLREMARLEEMEREQDEEIERENERENAERKEVEQMKKQKKISIREPEGDKENHITPLKTNTNSKVLSTCTPPPVLPLPALTTPLTQAVLKTMSAIPPEQFTSPKTSQGKKFGHVIRTSIDKTLQAYKTSTLGQVTSGRSTPARSLDIDIKDAPNFNKNELPRPKGSSQAQRSNWENEVNSSLPIVHNAVKNERVAADSRMDRLNIWMQNVEKVVEDARQSFAASARLDTPLPSLPVAPSSRSRNGSRNTANRSTYSSRLPRKVLAANEIFADYNSSLMADTSMATSSSALGTSDLGTTSRSSMTGNASPSASGSTPPTSHPASVDGEGAKQFLVPEIHTPSRRRRVTVSEDSPVAMRRGRDVDLTPSKKHSASARFLQQRIASFSKLEAEINKPIEPEPCPRLSEMFDRNVFIATPLRSYDNLSSSHESLIDDLNASPEHVEPYPSRKPNAQDVLPDTPQLRRLEGVYDRFLMATSGVKRVGKGYQSEFVATAASSSNCSSSNNGNNRGISRRHSRALFGVGRTPMPPPVSSEDCVRRGISVDELGMLSYEDEKEKEEAGRKTVAFMKKAIKAMVPSTKSSKRHSKMIMV